MRALVNPVVLLCGMAGMFSASVQPPTVLPGEVRNPELADVDPSLRKGDRLALAANRSGPSTASNQMWIESSNVRDEAAFRNDLEEDAPIPLATRTTPRNVGTTDLPEEELCDTLVSTAKANDLPLAFFTNLIWQESRFDPTSVSRAGARGIAQFMPGTAAQYGVDDPFDPSQALPASARLLRQLQLQFGNLGLAAAAYNAGPGRVTDWLRKGKALPKETRSYVRIITGRPAESWRGSMQDAAFRLTPQLPCRDLPVFQDLDAAASAQLESTEAEPTAVKNIGVERSHHESITHGQKARIRSAMTFRGKGGKHRSVRLASR
jgi:Transglycosylase SLT domain